MRDHFVQYSSLSGQLLSLRTCKTAFQSLLAFQVSVEKSPIWGHYTLDFYQSYRKVIITPDKLD